jgi:hypothetical protein
MSFNFFKLEKKIHFGQVFFFQNAFPTMEENYIGNIPSTYIKKSNQVLW